jgi:hypothetical protein
MKFGSNSLLYYAYKIFAFCYCAIFFAAGILELYLNEISIRLVISTFVLSGISIFIFSFLVNLNAKFVQVEISKDNICILNPYKKIDWSEVKSIRFRWFGLYHLKLEDHFYIFPPYDLGINIFGHKLFNDEFDDLINEKKKHFEI